MAKTPIAVLGIDLGKNSCSVAGLDASGAVVLRRKMTRETLVAFASKLPACIVAMEACCGAHFLGRTFAAQGHTVRLMSPEYVQPYVKSQKTDDRDAEAIAEAATRPTMRLVTLKSEAQLDLQVLHRARERLVTARTRLTNQLRAVLLERGVILPKRRAPLRYRLHELTNGPDVEVFIVPGGNFPTMPFIANWEHAVGKPVVTTNQATLWAMIQMRADEKLPGFGRLLEEMPAIRGSDPPAPGVTQAGP
jgi:hypothetical protein